MNTIWFTSDLHLGHKNIITYQKNRNFKNIDEHNEAIIKEINELVNPNDTLWILGDIAFGKTNLHYVNKIKSKYKRLVLGNHDTYDAMDYISAGFSKVFGMVTFKEFLLTHAPVHTQQLDTRYNYNIHGHLHNESIDDKRYVNVNWDITKPLTLEQIRQITEEK